MNEMNSRNFDPLENNIRKLMSHAQPGLTMPQASKEKILAALTGREGSPSSLLQTFFMKGKTMMKSRIVKFGFPVAAAIVLMLLAFWPEAGVTPKVYGMSDIAPLIKQAKTFHLHGWAYPRGTKALRQEIQHWADLETGQFRMVKPGGTDPKTGKPYYSTQICDGKYILKETYHQPLEGESYLEGRYTQMSAFQAKLLTRNNVYSFIMQTFGNLDRITGTVKIDQETIDGISYDIWERVVIIPSPGSERSTKISVWLDPTTGNIGKMLMWMKNKEEWALLGEFDRFEFNVPLSQELFSTKPPAGLRMANTKDTAPMEELSGDINKVCSGSLAVQAKIGFTLSDGSVILGWQSIDANHPDQADLFNGLELGGALPKLPIEIYGLETLPAIPNGKYNGYHLAHTQKGGKYYEWSIYVCENKTTPLRHNILGYALLNRSNVDIKASSLALAIHDDLMIATQEDFDTWVLGAMADLSDNGMIPKEITYENIMALSSRIRESLNKEPSKTLENR
jgi:hypothetical protein